MLGIVDAFMKRKSCRNFSGPLPEEKMQIVRDIVKDVNKLKTPYGMDVSLDITEPGIGTMNFIENEAGWIVQKFPMDKLESKDVDKYIVDMTYLASIAVLRLTQNHINTVWAAGTFDRKLVASRFPGFTIQCVVAFGIDSGLRNPEVQEKLKPAKCHTRLSSDELFYDEEKKEMIKSSEGKLHEFLECLRWLPSSSNSQTWRVSVNMSKNQFKVFNVDHYHSIFNVGIMISGFYFYSNGKCTIDMSESTETFPTGGKLYATITLDPSVLN